MVPLILLLLMSLHSGQSQYAQWYTTSTTTDHQSTVVQQHSSTTTNETEKDLYKVFVQLKDIKDWMKEPYVHGLILPAIVGMSAALLSVGVLCCINYCIKNRVRKRRRRKIRHLAKDLKTDRAMLLGDESDEDF